MTQKSFYAGLLATSGTLGTVRPPNFLGLRYDTDTTAPAISDSTLKFEVVSNPLTAFRNNTQGQVFDTGITPTQGVQYHLQIQCLTVGQVTMILTGGGVSVSNTFTIPKLVVANTGGTQGNGQIGRVSLGSSVLVPFGPGSQVTFSAFSGAEATLNGTKSLIDNNNSGQMTFYSVYNTFNNSVAFSLTGYPAYVPGIIYGNDTTATPTSNVACAIDFYGFVWNPGVGGGAGTVNPLLPRYF
jgi:hypothetical protein